MLGVMIGDIAGSFREFTGENKYKELGLLPDRDLIPLNKKGEPSRYGITDDSILTVATAYTLIQHGTAATAKDFALHYHGIGNKYFDPVGGYGGGFKKWLKSPAMLPYNSLGNGSAMRVSPVGYVGRDVDEVLDLAYKSAITTHNHPEGIKGAQATALMVYLARKGWKMDSIIPCLNAQYLGYEPCEGFTSFDAICPETMRLVMHVLLTTDNFHDAVLKAVTIPFADSDTLGAIVGSIAEPMYGIPDDIKNKALGFLSDMNDPMLNIIYSKFTALYMDVKNDEVPFELNF